MRSQSENILITFNGEIYNHLEIREKINKIKKKFNLERLKIQKLF